MAGEAVDSWLEATAAHLGTTVGALARDARLSVATRPEWIRWIGPDELSALQAVTGISAVAIQAMTLQSYDGRALRLDPISHRLDHSFPFGPLPQSRFCPKCLKETRGRWQLSWRLGWSFLCAEHQCLLADECLQCGSHQRRQQNYSRQPSPSKCVCGYDLSSAPVRWLGDEHPVVEAQRVVSEVIANGVATVGLFAATPTPAREALAQIRSIANRVLNFASEHGFQSVQPEVLTDGFPTDDVTQTPWHARSTLNNNAPNKVIETALGVSAAWAILRQTTVGVAGASARWLVDRQNADTGPAELRTVGRDGPLSAAVVIAARRPALGPELQLRYRAAVTVPCAPDLDVSRVRIIGASLPAAMWHEWSDLLLLDVRPTAVMRRALSCATLLAGSTVKPSAAAHILGEQVTPNAMNHRLWALQGSHYWLTICAAVIRLSDYLDAHGAPIDYSRRRRLDYSAVLTNDMWRRILRKNPIPAGRFSVTTARNYLMAQLSGSPVPDVKSAALVSAFRKSINPYLSETLTASAQIFLDERGIDEPVSWHAPLTLLSDLPLPQRN